MKWKAYSRSGAAGPDTGGPHSSGAFGSRGGVHGFNDGSSGTKSYRFTYWTSDGYRTIRRETYVYRDTGGIDDTWPRFFGNRLFDKEEAERLVFVCVIFFIVWSVKYPDSC